MKRWKKKKRKRKRNGKKMVVLDGRKKSPKKQKKKKTEKKTTLSGCHSILGQVAAKRGDLDEADGHFKRAVEVGKQGIKMPMVELVAARDWKRFLLEPNGRDPSAADAAIDSACAAMNKTREQLASVLSKSS